MKERRWKAAVRATVRETGVEVRAPSRARLVEVALLASLPFSRMQHRPCVVAQQSLPLFSSSNVVLLPREIDPCSPSFGTRFSLALTRLRGEFNSLLCIDDCVTTRTPDLERCRTPTRSFELLAQPSRPLSFSHLAKLSPRCPPSLPIPQMRRHFVQALLRSFAHLGKPLLCHAVVQISWHTGFTSKNSTSDRVLLPLLHLHPH